jgi:nucleotide-binding universal stress UspA family protein
MTTALPSYKQILVPVDLSARGARSLPHAYALLKGGGVVHLLQVIEQPDVPNPMYAHYSTTSRTPEERAKAYAIAEDGIARLTRECPAPVGVELKVHVIDAPAGKVSTRICELSKETGADLIALASHGRSGLGRMLLGSVAENVLRHAEVPVFVVRVPSKDLS